MEYLILWNSRSIEKSIMFKFKYGGIIDELILKKSRGVLLLVLSKYLSLKCIQTDEKFLIDSSKSSFQICNLLVLIP